MHSTEVAVRTMSVQFADEAVQYSTEIKCVQDYIAHRSTVPLQGSHRCGALKTVQGRGCCSTVQYSSNFVQGQ